MPQSQTAKILFDEAELALECGTLSRSLQLPVEAELLAQATQPGNVMAYAFTHPPTVEQLHEIATQGAFVAMITEDEVAGATVGLARDLGIAAVTELRPLLAMIALQLHGAERPWAADLRGLNPVDRVRLGALRRLRQQGGGALESTDGQVVWRGEAGQSGARLGDARDVLAAVRALHDAGAAKAAQPRARLQLLEASTASAIRDALFGPARLLSDPAAKSVLRKADVPCPDEYLCTSASRAASEASRIGYPCALSLASPDLRGWDYPELRDLIVESAAAAKTAFAQLRAVAEGINAGARIVGVTVAPTLLTQAELRIVMRPFRAQRAIAEIGFADPHGLASQDLTHTVLPVSSERVERILMRLRGNALLLPHEREPRRHVVSGFSDVLTKATRLLATFPDALCSLRFEPLRLLVSGDWIVGEASVEISEHYEKQVKEVASAS